MGGVEGIEDTRSDAMTLDSGSSVSSDSSWPSVIHAALPAIAATLDATVSKVQAAVVAANAASSGGASASSGPPVPIDNARSALRVLDCLVTRMGAEAPCRAIADLVLKVESNDVLARLYAAVKADKFG